MPLSRLGYLVSWMSWTSWTALLLGVTACRHAGHFQDGDPTTLAPATTGSGQGFLRPLGERFSLEPQVDPVAWDRCAREFLTWARTLTPAPEGSGIFGPSADPLLTSDLPQGKPNLFRPITADNGPPPARVAIHNQVYAKRPRVTFAANGDLHVNVETNFPVVGGALYVGAQAPRDPFARARYRISVPPAEISPDGRVLTFKAPRVILLHKKYDMAAMNENGRGTFNYLVEVWAPKDGSTRLFEGQAPFVCHRTPCIGGADAVTPVFASTPAIENGPHVDWLPRVANGKVHGLEHGWDRALTRTVVSWKTQEPTAGAVVVLQAGQAPTWIKSPSVTRTHRLELSQVLKNSAAPASASPTVWCRCWRRHLVRRISKKQPSPTDAAP